MFVFNVSRPNQLFLILFIVVKVNKVKEFVDNGFPNVRL